jgi:hypothetical protein
VKDNQAVIVKNRGEQRFKSWLGRGGRTDRRSIDNLVDQIRGKTE